MADGGFDFLWIEMQHRPLSFQRRDLTSFSGSRQNKPDCEALVTRVFAATTKAGLNVGGPHAWQATRNGYSFFQARREHRLPARRHPDRAQRRGGRRDTARRGTARRRRAVSALARGHRQPMAAAPRL